MAANNRFLSPEDLIRKGMGVKKNTEKGLQAFGMRIRKNLDQGQKDLASGKVGRYGYINPIR